MRMPTASHWTPMTFLVLLFVAPLLFDEVCAQSLETVPPTLAPKLAPWAKSPEPPGRCGPEFGGELCPKGSCCSIYGWCGGGDPWCGVDCASQCPSEAPAPAPKKHSSPAPAPKKVSPAPAPKKASPPPPYPWAESPEAPGRCGPEFHGERCPNGSCCSVFGWCGGGEPWCGVECASQCPSKAPAPAPKKPSSPAPAPKKVSPAPAPKKASPPPPYPWAESPEAPGRCGPEFHGERCPNGSCCSVFGWCGGGEPWCGVECASQCPSKAPAPAPKKPSSPAPAPKKVSPAPAPKKASPPPPYPWAESPEAPGRCGPEFHGERCPNGSCCSIYGWCGGGDPWCGIDCESQCPSEAPAPAPKKHSSPAPAPKKVSPAPAPKKTSPPPPYPWAESPEAPGRCGPEFHGELCPKGSCCSIFGWCGGGDPWCGIDCASQCPSKAPAPAPKKGLSPAPGPRKASPPHPYL